MVKNNQIDFKSLDKQLDQLIKKYKQNDNKKKIFQLSVTSAVFGVVLLSFLLLTIGCYYIIFYKVFNTPQIDKDIMEAILKLCKNTSYKVGDFLQMMVGACVAWFFKGKIDEKNIQSLENQITALEEQKHCSQCGKEM